MNPHATAAAVAARNERGSGDALRGHGRGGRWVLVSFALVVGVAAGCEGPPLPRRTVRPPAPAGATIEELAPGGSLPLPPPVSEVPIDLDATGQGRSVTGRVIARAFSRDDAADGDALVSAQRCVYRVELAVPEVLGSKHASLGALSAELYVDVSEDRLRARFVGAGWPVEAGSEVRLRADRPGVYVFDRDGGRPLVAGGLAPWFEGGPTTAAGPTISVRRDPTRRGSGVPGGLLCALIAEWSGEPREAVLRRCEGAAPLTFRVGPWRAERTADVPIQLPRRLLRADEADPPRPIGQASSRAFLEPTALTRITPLLRARGSLDEAAAPETADGLEFVNDSDARVLVVVEGTAIGWVDAARRGTFRGLLPARYRVSGLSPLGVVVMRPRGVVVPGSTTLGDGRAGVSRAVAGRTPRALNSASSPRPSRARRRTPRR